VVGTLDREMKMIDRKNPKGEAVKVQKVHMSGLSEITFDP
jgi:hypothetical protein